MTSEPISVPRPHRFQFVQMSINRLLLDTHNPELVAALMAAYADTANIVRDLETFNGAIVALEPLKQQKNRKLRRLRWQLLTLMQHGIAQRYPTLAAQITALANEPRTHRAFPWRGVSAVITALAALIGALASSDPLFW